MSREIILKCNWCDTLYEPQELLIPSMGNESAQVNFEKARADGWLNHGPLDACPACAPTAFVVMPPAVADVFRKFDAADRADARRAKRWWNRLRWWVYYRLHREEYNERMWYREHADEDEYGNEA